VAYNQVSSAASPSYTQWIASTAPNGESWRLWASFFLGGLYGPVAGRYLYNREEWNAGVSSATSVPVAPSARGLVVLAMFFGLPTLSMLVIGLSMSAAGLHGFYGPSAQEAESLRMLGYLNLFVSAFYTSSVLVARDVERRFRLLLYELTSGDRGVMRLFERGRLSRTIAMAFGLLPLLVVIYGNSVMLFGWHSSVATILGLYFLVTAVATFATSWLNVSQLARFRRAMLSAP
jgi:hypothetical protein